MEGTPVMTQPLLEVRGLIKHFPLKSGVFSRTTGAVRAVDGVSFSIEKGHTLSLVGESGSGKTTIGRLAIGLEDLTEGKVTFDGIDLSTLSKEELRKMRK